MNHSELIARLLRKNENGTLCEITEEDQQAAADALQALERVPMTWKPIETAPKDFVTEFDGWNGERIPNVIWAKPDYAPKGEYAWCQHEYVQHHGWVLERVSGLTHWMPLPTPPESKG